MEVRLERGLVVDQGRLYLTDGHVTDCSWRHQSKLHGLHAVLRHTERGLLTCLALARLESRHVLLLTSRVFV